VRFFFLNPDNSGHSLQRPYISSKNLKNIFQKANSMKTDKFHCDEQTFFIVHHAEMKSNITTSEISREM